MRPSAISRLPGAKSLPIAAVLTEDGRFRPASDIAAAFEAVGAEQGTPIAAYCGSGITSATLAEAA